MIRTFIYLNSNAAVVENVVQGFFVAFEGVARRLAQSIAQSFVRSGFGVLSSDPMVNKNLLFFISLEITKNESIKTLP